MTKHHGHRVGFTLIELIVVVGIVGTLVGLLLSAVQKVRDAALRGACQNNLKQMGLALHQYHDQNQQFPSGVTWDQGASTQPFLSWMARILPYIEQGELWSLTEQAFAIDPNFLDNPPHTAASAVIKIFGCPADQRSVRASKYQLGFTSYQGNEGLNFQVPLGVLYLDSQRSMADISDGTSNTFLVGERPPSGDERFGWWYAGEGQRRTGSADSVLGVNELMVEFEYYTVCSRGPYSYGPGSVTDPCSTFHYWSLHTEGGQFLFCDGSAHFIAYSAASLLPALSTIAGGETTSLPD